MLIYDPYQSADSELEQQIRECMEELGYEVDEEEDVVKDKVTVH